MLVRLCTHAVSMPGSRWWAMCFWYQTGWPPGTGPVKAAATARQSVVPAAITSSRPGWSRPVACR